MNSKSHRKWNEHPRVIPLGTTFYKVHNEIISNENKARNRWFDTYGHLLHLYRQDEQEDGYTQKIQRVPTSQSLPTDMQRPKEEASECHHCCQSSESQNTSENERNKMMCEPMMEESGQNQRRLVHASQSPDISNPSYPIKPMGEQINDNNHSCNPSQLQETSEDDRMMCKHQANNPRQSEDDRMMCRSSGKHQANNPRQNYHDGQPVENAGKDEIMVVCEPSSDEATPCCHPHGAHAEDWEQCGCEPKFRKLSFPPTCNHVCNRMGFRCWMCSKQTRD